MPSSEGRFWRRRFHTHTKWWESPIFMYSYQPLSQKPSKSFSSTPQHIYVPISGLEVFGRLAGSEPQWLVACLCSLPWTGNSLFSLSPVEGEDLWKVCMLALLLNVLHLAEPVCATWAVSASVKTALLFWEPIIIHRVSHKSEFIGILFLKAG